jgi:hypothetical protein
MASLVVDPVTLKATFVSKANLQNITDPQHPDSLGGNLTLNFTLTDAGESGTPDMVGFTLWKGTQLLYSSRWNGTQTIEQLLAGGNTVVHAGNRLEAASGSTNDSTATSVSNETLNAAIQQAINAWASAGISAAQIHELHETKFIVAELPQSTLGLSLGDTVWIDSDAAGLGWSPAGGAFDLVTTVAHELGHVLGVDHSPEQGVMHDDLAPGTRALPMPQGSGFFLPEASSEDAEGDNLRKRRKIAREKERRTPLSPAVFRDRDAHRSFAYIDRSDNARILRSVY